MNFKSTLKSLALTSSALTVGAASGHPGHEPEDFIHAIAHELASPRGVLALVVLGVGALMWLYAKRKDREIR
jgi:hypothetical protein